MTLTIGKLLLEDFMRAQFSLKKLAKLLIFVFELSDRNSLIFGPAGVPEPPVHRGILYIFYVVGHEF